MDPESFERLGQILGQKGSVLASSLLLDDTFLKAFPSFWVIMNVVRKAPIILAALEIALVSLVIIPPGTEPILTLFEFRNTYGKMDSPLL